MSKKLSELTAEDVRVLSNAFDALCELTGIPNPSDRLARRFAEAVVAAALKGHDEPSAIAATAMATLGLWVSYSQRDGNTSMADIGGQTGRHAS